MTSRILLLGVALIGLGSCSTMYKSGQTPDDVYYSPAPQLRTASSDNDESDDRYYDNGSNEYVNVQTEQDRSAYNSEDNYLRMKVRNRSMWSTFDSYSMYDAMYSPYYGGFGGGFGGYGLGYGYNPYSFYSPYSMYSPYSSFGGGWGLGLGWGGMYGGMNSFYNPYYGYGGGGYYYPGNIKTGVTRPANSYRPRTGNLGSYGTSNNSGSGRVNNANNAPRRVFRSSNDNNYVNPGRSSSNDSPRRSSAGSGNDSRPSRSYDSPRSSSPSPSYSPSSSGGSSRGSSGGGGGGSAPSRPGRN